jgi:hypothetical protein
MKNRTIDIGAVVEIAKALQELRYQVVFVGGAIVSLYTDDPAADEIRPTNDIDMTVNILNFSKWTKIQERLVELGFSPDPFGHSVCSYKYKDIPVDMMLAENSVFGPSNKWYKVGSKDLWNVLAKNEEIRIFSAPVFLATKFEAFNSRGKDYRTNHDFENIIYVLDNRTTIVSEVMEADKEIKQFLKLEFIKVIQNTLAEEIQSAHIHPLIFEERSNTCRKNKKTNRSILRIF